MSERPRQFWSGVLVLALACAAFMCPLPAHSQPATSSLPLAATSLTWNSALQRFEGRAVFQMTPDMVDGSASSPQLALVLPPNAALRWASDSRSQQELFSVGYPSEDLSFIDRSGALTVTLVSLRQGPQQECRREHLDSSVVQKVSAQEMGFSPVPWHYERFETAIRVEGVNPADEPCSLLMVDFAMVPPRQKGNNGLSVSGRAVFSAGLSPMVRGAFHRMSARLNHVDAWCRSCRRQSDRSTMFEYDLFPYPVHAFLPEGLAKSTTTTSELLHRSFQWSGIDVWVLGAPSDGFIRELQSIVHQIMGAFPSLSQRAPLQHSVELVVVPDVLAERLAMVQIGEVQTGPGLFRTAPGLSRFHRAALARELLILLYEQSLQHRFKPRSWREYRHQAVLARVLAEHSLGPLFGGLDAVKKFSESLDFVPLFEDILRGRALQHNEVFLGEREPPSLVDVSLVDLLVPHMSGRQVLERTRHCGGSALVDALTTQAALVAKGEVRVDEFLSWLQDQPKDATRCPSDIAAFFDSRPLRERFTASRIELGFGLAKVQVHRARKKDLQEDFFGHDDARAGGPIYRDAPRVVIRDKVSGLYLVDRVWQVSDSESLADSKSIEKVVDSEDSIMTAIEGPTMGSHPDRHVFPRRVKFSITGLRLSYDSSDSRARVESGFQFRLLGDDFARAMILGAAIDGDEAELSSTLRMDLLRFFVSDAEGDDEDSTYDGLAQAKSPRTFTSLPMSFGVLETIGFGSHSRTSILAEVAAANQSIDPLVPRGYRVGLRTKWQIFEDLEFNSVFAQEAYASYDQGIGRLTTVSLNPIFGISDGRLRFADYVPGASRDLVKLKSSEFFAFKSSLKSVVKSGLHVDLLGALLFQNVVTYVSHHVASDVSVFTESGRVRDLNQSVQVGLQLFGAVFGAKNQSVGLSLTRTLSGQSKNVFALTIGK